MKNCLECGTSQETGKFCGKCGSLLGVSVSNEQVSATTETVSQEGPSFSQPVAPQVQPSVHVEKVKAQSKAYWSYFLNFIKNPSKVFNAGNKEFINGMISIVILAAIIGLAIYGFVQSITSSIFGSVGSLFENEYVGPSFLSIFSSIVFFILLTVLIVLLSMFIVGKAFGSGDSWKELISYYGAHILSVILLSLFGLFLMLIKSYLYGNIILVISFLIILIVIPLYIMSRLLSNSPKGIDSYYGYLLYIVLVCILYSIFISVIADSTIGQYLNYFTDY